MISWEYRTQEPVGTATYDAGMASSELGDYLRARRAQIRPDEVNLPVTGYRRVPGLRREEMALLVGVTCRLHTP